MNQHHPHPTSGATPTPGKGGRAARENTGKANSTTARLKSPRQIRTLQALLKGPIRREHLDRVAGASNSPDVVMTLCRRFGLRIDCDTTQAVTDRDGRKAYPGVYSLHPDDKPKAIGLLKNSESTTC